MTNQNVEKISVSLGEIERNIVDRQNKDLGLNNFSAALRTIIHDWDKNKAHWIGTSTQEVQVNQPAEAAAHVATVNAGGE